MVYTQIFQRFNPFKPEFTFVILIHYEPRMTVAILNSGWKWPEVGGKWKKMLLLKPFLENIWS